MLVKLKKPFVQDGRVADVGETIDVNQAQLVMLMQNNAVELLNQSVPQYCDYTEDDIKEIPQVAESAQASDIVEGENINVTPIEVDTAVADNATQVTPSADDKSGSGNEVKEEAYVTLGSNKRGGKK